MDRIIRLTVEFLPEGVFLATSDDPQGLLVEAATRDQVLEIADDIARIVIEDDGGDATVPRRFDWVEVPHVVDDWAWAASPGFVTAMSRVARAPSASN